MRYSDHRLIETGLLETFALALRPDFTSKLVHVLAFGTPKFYIAPYDKIKHELVNLSSNCDVKSGLRLGLLPRTVDVTSECADRTALMRLNEMT